MSLFFQNGIAFRDAGNSDCPSRIESRAPESFPCLFRGMSNRGFWEKDGLCCEFLGWDAFFSFKLCARWPRWSSARPRYIQRYRGQQWQAATAAATALLRTAMATTTTTTTKEKRPREESSLHDLCLSSMCSPFGPTARKDDASSRWQLGPCSGWLCFGSLVGCPSQGIADAQIG